MIIENVWKIARSFVPVQLYPLLSPIYRWRRRTQLRRLEESDRAYLALHPQVFSPNAELRYNVVGPCTIEQFLSSGDAMVDDIEGALRSVGRSLDQVHAFLDFGCGCGRLLIALRARRPGLLTTGCDVDERGVSWCHEHLPGIRCLVNGDMPPAPFENGSFDVIWCGSVFTHLDETRQDRWLAEMRRMLKPGGILLASVHGPYLWKPRLPPWTIANLKRKGIIFARLGADTGTHPSWYQVAWHTEEYIHEHWAQILEIRGYRERGLNDYQDVVVAQKRG